MIHRPTLELVEAVPAEVDAGVRIVTLVSGSCPEGCDLGAGRLLVTGTDGAVGTVPLAVGGPTEIELTVPRQIGEASWAIAFPEQEVGGVLHQEAVVTVASRVKPHDTSMAVWDVPSPIRGSTFTVRVGIKCSLGCGLGDHRVEVRDDQGAKVGEARLSDAPREGTSALHEAEISLVAPDRPGVFSRRAVYDDPSGSVLPHAASAAEFTFRVLEPPEHVVAVSVERRGFDAPGEGIEVRLGPYRAYTDPEGVARVGVPTGTYEVSIWRIDLEPWAASLEVNRDTEVEVVATPRRPVDEDAERTWM